ncbi:hypothetical protein NIES2134_118280 [Thermostichus vulcanus NIES-2134]|nr:hypothetical protein NIES2134_118280 [Thermostichus vulcanus NIES-2134]
MLQTLRIQNFALIAELEVTFQGGSMSSLGKQGQESHRIHQLQRLCRKYGPDLASVIAYRDRIQAELAALRDATTSQECLEAEVAQRRQVLEQASEQLHQLRQGAAERLQQDLLAHLGPLGLPQARFTVQLTTTEASSSGSDEITFLWSANPGQPLQPLGEIASGGEMKWLALPVM